MIVNKIFLILKELKITIRFYFLVFFSIISSLFEVISIASIIPIMGILINPDLITNLPILKNFFIYFYKIDFLNSLILDNQNYLIFIIILMLIFIFLTKFFFQIFYEWYKADTVYKINYEISSYLFKYYLNKPYNFHVNTNSSKLHRNIQGSATGFSNMFRGIILIFTESLSILGLLSLLFFYEWKITTITLFLLLLIGSIFLFSTSRLNILLGKKVHIQTQKRIGYLIDGFEGIKDLILYDKIQSLLKLFDHSNEEFGKANRLFSIIITLPKIVIEFLFIFAVMMVILILVFTEQNLSNFLPLISLYVLSMIRIAPSTFRILNANQQIKFNKTSIDHIYIDLKSAIQKSDNYDFFNYNYILKFQKSIQLKNINFSYKKKQIKILKNLNLNIKKGECIGIYGESGSGKSTFLNIVTGLFKPSSGNILCDNIDIFKNLKSWRKNIGYVPQNVYLLDRDIKKNISLNLSNNFLNKINYEYALKVSGLKKLTNNLQSRLHNNLGEKGKKISGGQLQRIGIARAIYNRPNILIFDEATNALDKEIEKKIFKSIYDLKNKNTILIVSHKLELLKSCDRIYKLNKGKLIRKKNSIFK